MFVSVFFLYRNAADVDLTLWMLLFGVPVDLSESFELQYLTLFNVTGILCCCDDLNWLLMIGCGKICS
jgi:hypothetical protein